MRTLRLMALGILLMAGASVARAQQNVTLAQAKQAALDSLTSPSTLNQFMAGLEGAIKDTGVYKFIHDLDLNFKTFQANNQPPGLGFSYQYMNQWTKSEVKPTFQLNQSFNINLDGNVAFKKVYNPTNFLDSKASYSATLFWGGIPHKNSRADANSLRAWRASRDSAGKTGNEQQYDAYQKKIDQLTHKTDLFVLDFNGAPAFESNQDFSSTQLAPGLQLSATAQFYEGSPLRWLNLPDYPFALLRFLLNNDHNFDIKGTGVPTVQFSVDYVVPTNDSVRKAVTGALNPFTRLRFEASFKTEAANVGGQTIWFSADYRWHHQLSPSQVLINAHIATFNYFSCNLSASNGFFVGYSAGALPFDIKSTVVYSIGFSYNLGGW